MILDNCGVNKYGAAEWRATLYCDNRRIIPSYYETLDCKAEAGDVPYRYTGGYSSATDTTSTMLLSTEQEFCDNAKDLLADAGVDWMTLTRISWENHWWRLVVDELDIPEALTKVDFARCPGELERGARATLTFDGDGTYHYKALMLTGSISSRWMAGTSRWERSQTAWSCTNMTFSAGTLAIEGLGLLTRRQQLLVIGIK